MKGDKKTIKQLIGELADLTRSVSLSMEELERCDAVDGEELRSVEAGHKAELDKVEAKRKNEMQKLNAARKAEVDRLIADHRKELKDLEKSYADEMELLDNERRKAEVALQESQRRYAMMVENLADVIFMLDNDLSPTYVSANVSDLLGYKVREITAETIQESIFPVSVMAVLKTFEKEISRKKAKPEKLEISRVMETEFKTRKGDSVWAQVRLSVVHDTEDRPVGIMGFIRDVTARKMAQGAMEKTETNTRSILAQVSEGILIIDGKNKVRYVNPALEELWGRPAADVVGTTFNPPAMTGSVTEINITKKDGARCTAEMRLGRVTWLDEDMVLVLLRDISESAKLRDELHSMSLMDELTGLNNMKGFVNLANHQLKIADRTKKGMILFYIEVDKLGWIAQKFGDKEKSAAIIEAANIINGTFRKADVTARLDASRFVVLALEAQKDSARIMVTRIRQNLETHNALQSRPFDLALNIDGIFYDTKLPCTIHDLMTKADRLVSEKKMRKQKSGPRKITA
ncbi:MAG: PAS domain S-box protein [Pseudomonadota bacterium]